MCETSEWAYLSQYLWIVLSAYLIVRPFGILYSWACIINFIVAEFCVFASYYLLAMLFSCGRKNKGNKK